MDSNHLLIGSVAIAFILSFTLLASQDQEKQEFNNLDFNHTSDQIQKTSAGKKYLVHPDQLIEGCPKKDCIPSIDDPEFVGPDVEWIDAEEEVIGITSENSSKAYPLKILDSHEIINDQIGGEKVAVTYCPLCRSALAYSRELENRTLEFGVSGKLKDANLIMYDRQTGSLWSQIGGRAVIGPLTSKELDLKSSSITEWSDWRNKHPDTQLLSRDTGIYPASTYSRRQYQRYMESETVGYGVNEVDDRLKPKEVVYGIRTSGQTKAYPETIVRNQGLINDNVGGDQIIIFEDPKDNTINAYNVSHLDRNFSVSDAVLKDSSGGKWSFSGDKQMEEKSLDEIDVKGFYWFAWIKFNSQTTVYRK